MGDIEEASMNYELDYNTIDVAISALRKHFNITVCEGSDQPVPNTTHQQMYLSGNFLGVSKVLVQLLIGFVPARGCVVRAIIKAEEEGVADGLLESLR